MTFTTLRTAGPRFIAPRRATLYERVRLLAATDPKAAVALAHAEAPVAAQAIIDRLNAENGYR